MIGGSYDFEVFKLALAYNRVTDGWFAGKKLPNGGSVGAFTGTPSYAFSKGFRSNSYFIGLSAPLGGGSSLFASWQRADANNKKLTGGDSASNTYSLGYNYSLSKRTDVYAIASHTSNWAFVDGIKATGRRGPAPPLLNRTARSTRYDQPVDGAILREGRRSVAAPFLAEVRGFTRDAHEPGKRRTRVGHHIMQAQKISQCGTAPLAIFSTQTLRWAFPALICLAPIHADTGRADVNTLASGSALPQRKLNPNPKQACEIRFTRRSFRSLDAGG